MIRRFLVERMTRVERNSLEVGYSLAEQTIVWAETIDDAVSKAQQLYTTAKKGDPMLYVWRAALIDRD